MLIAEKAVALTSRKDPRILDTLAAAYAEAGQFTNAVNVQKEAMALLQSDEEKQGLRLPAEALRVRLPYHDPALLAERIRVLAGRGKVRRGRTAGPRVPGHSRKALPDDWRTFNARSLLGGSLLGQKKYAEAEPLLLSGYEGMKQREDKISRATNRV